VELQNTKRQCELVKSLLADATAEKEIMYEVGITLFNQMLGAYRYPRRSTKSWMLCITMHISRTTKLGPT
jgi:hypothetical protein